jgi:exosortase
MSVRAAVIGDETRESTDGDPSLPRGVDGSVWSRWFAVGTVGVPFLLLFAPTIIELFRDWGSSGEYGHGFLLLPVGLYLGWRSRVEETTPARVLGIAILLGGVLLFLAGTVAAEFFTRRLAVLLSLAGLVIYHRGGRQLRAWWLPFALIAFTIPLPEVVLNSLTLPLQLLASRMAVAMLEARHVPVALAGNVILLPGQELFVAEACSGLRSLSALLGLTLLIGGTALKWMSTRAVLLLLAIPAAIVANAFRVFGTGFGAYYIGPDVVHGPVHLLAGGLVFLLPLGLVGLATIPLRRIES